MTSQPVDTNAVMVGSYSLESLTTGMYEDPLHCVREYVQNGFDAIRSARGEEVLAAEAGLVAISISGTAKRLTLTVEDDGMGIPAADAVGALVSVGASRKRSNANAGFRGIGRLAGVAYCASLRFTTTFPGEATATVVDFDCARMRGFMRPGAELQDVRAVIQACVTTAEITAAADAHGTKVEMIGLTGLGVEFAEIGKLVPYLRQVCPTDYSDRFSFAQQIRDYAKGVGHPIPIVDVETRYKRERTQILKGYDNATPTSKGASNMSGIETVGSAELGWFGWIGKSDFKGELTDDNVAGIRFRVRNIQIDGSDLIESLAAELTTGGTEGRLQRYAVGEIFVTSPAVVPNARRDGFEDGPAWRQIKADLRTKVAKRVIALVRNASKSRSRIKAIGKEIAELRQKLTAATSLPADAESITKQIDSLLARLKPDKLTGGEPNQIGSHVSEVKSLRERLNELRSKSASNPAAGGGGGGGGGRAGGGAAGAGGTVGSGGGAGAGGIDGSGRPKGDMPGDGGGGTRNGEGGDPAPAGEASGQPDDDHDDGAGWTAEELLPVLRAVMMRELGEGPTERLFELAFDELEDG